MRVEGRRGETERWCHAVVSGRQKKQKKKKGEVRRSEVVLWRVRGGWGEEAVSEWKDRHQPTEVMTNINADTESQMLNAKEL